VSQPAIKISVVTPCFNEVEVVGETYRRFSNVCLPYNSCYEIVFVDDGPNDTVSSGEWSAGLGCASGRSFMNGKPVLRADPNIPGPR
jgi:hypothetical protein